MRKKILAVSAAILIFAVMAVACGKAEEYDKTDTYNPIEYTTDESGEKYVTNIYGDLIPVTTDKDGSVELLEDLYTKTKEQAEKEEQSLKDEATATGNNQSNNQGGSGNNTGNNAGNNSGNNSGNSSGGIQVGSNSPKDEGKEAVIVW